MNKLELKINGMTCRGCSSSVENLIDKLPGILFREVNHQNGLAVVEYDSEKISEKEIIEKINEGHYKVSGYEKFVSKQKNLSCPVCKKEGSKVPETVFSSVLKPEFKSKIDTSVENFVCTNPSCDVAYFTESYSLDKSSLKRPLWFKETSKERIICYCNNISEAQIEEAVKTKGLTGWDEIISGYRKKVIERCEKLNPLGICCKEVFMEVVDRYTKRDA